MAPKRRAYYELRKRIVQISQILKLNQELLFQSLDTIGKIEEHCHYSNYCDLAMAIIFYCSRFQDKQLVLRDFLRQWNTPLYMVNNDVNQDRYYCGWIFAGRVF